MWVKKKKTSHPHNSYLHLLPNRLAVLLVTANKCFSKSCNSSTTLTCLIVKIKKKNIWYSSSVFNSFFFKAGLVFGMVVLGIIQK